jgi:hypothetical protein
MFAKRAFVISIVLGLACVAEAQEAKTNEEWCAGAARALGGAGDQFLKAALLEKMKNLGCLGQPSTVAVPVTTFSVQVASKYTEAEARDAYQSLKSQYPDLFVGRQAFIRRADLGARGTFFRATVGPFNTADVAGEFCARLKAAGGMCAVQKN